MKPEISNTIAICILALLLTVLAWRVRALESVYVNTPASGSNGASSE